MITKRADNQRSLERCAQKKNYSNLLLITNNLHMYILVGHLGFLSPLHKEHLVQMLLFHSE